MICLSSIFILVEMNITGEMWTMKNLHGNHSANIMIKFCHYNMTKIMMCHHVGLLWLKHAIGCSHNKTSQKGHSMTKKSNQNWRNIYILPFKIITIMLSFFLFKNYYFFKSCTLTIIRISLYYFVRVCVITNN